MAAAATARRIVRFLYLALIVLFLAGILVQAMLAGSFLFGESGSGAHMDFGWPLAHMLAPLALLVSFFIKGGRPFWITSILWGILAFVQPILATLDEEGPSDAAGLHVVNALVLFALTLWLAWRAWGLCMEKAPAQPASARPGQNVNAVRPAQSPVARQAPPMPPPIRR